MTTQPAEQAEAAADGAQGSGDDRPGAGPGPRPETREPAVRAVGLGLKGPQGTVFSGIGFEAPPGSLVAIEGPSGSGRTCLLLTLTGRMRASEGHGVVHGHRMPGRLAAVRRISAVANVPGVTDLEQSHSVAQHLREQALMQRRFGSSPGRLPRLRDLFAPRAERTATDRARAEAALAAAGLDPAALPKGSRTRVRDLDRLERLRLSVALALLGEPLLLGVDDTELALRGPEREQAWELLRSVAASGVTVLAVCGEAPAGAVVVRTAEHGGSGGPQDGRAPDAARQRPDGAESGDGAERTERTDGRKNEDTSSEETADACAEAGRA